MHLICNVDTSWLQPEKTFNETSGAEIGAAIGAVISRLGPAISPRQEVIDRALKRSSSISIPGETRKMVSKLDRSPRIGHAKGRVQSCGTGLLFVQMEPSQVLPGDEVHIKVTTYSSDGRAPGKEVQIVQQPDSPAKTAVTIAQGKTDAFGDFSSNWQTPSTAIPLRDVLVTLLVYAFDVQKKDCSMSLLVKSEAP